MSLASIDNGDSYCSSNQVVDKDDNQGMECHPYSLSIDDDVFTIAFNVLELVSNDPYNADTEPPTAQDE